MKNARNRHFSTEKMREDAKRSFVERWRAMCKHDMKYDPSNPKVIGTYKEKNAGEKKNFAGINDLLGVSMPIFSDDNFLFMIGL